MSGIMAMQRSPGTPMRSLIGDIIGFEPFRSMASPEMLGFEVHRSDDGYQLEFPVAGFRPEDINVTLEDRVVTIEGHNERRRFTRALTLPDEIDADSIDAKVEHGMLTISLRLHPKAQPRKIPIQVTGGAGAPQQQAVGPANGTGSAAP